MKDAERQDRTGPAQLPRSRPPRSSPWSGPGAVVSLVGVNDLSVDAVPVVGGW